MKNYIEQAKLTESPITPELQSRVLDGVRLLRAVLHTAGAATAYVDDMKRMVFYNEKLSMVDLTEMNGIAVGVEKAYGREYDKDVVVKNIRILHAVMGKITEAAELAEELLKAIETGRPLDKVNMIEEVGDGLWYDAILLDELQSTFDIAMTPNISKLRAGRFKDKFTEYDAKNRDLGAERALLETGVAGPLPD